MLAKETPTTTEVVTVLLDLSEAMQALNTDESTDALREDVQATIDFINENILTNVEGLRPGKVEALEMRSKLHRHWLIILKQPPMS